MRLGRVSNGHRLPQRLKLGIFRILGGRVPDVVRTLHYRPEVFGRPFSAVLHHVMRGPSPWTVGERELFAAFVSAKNKCPF